MSDVSVLLKEQFSRNISDYTQAQLGIKKWWKEAQDNQRGIFKGVRDFCVDVIAKYMENMTRGQ